MMRTRRDFLKTAGFAAAAVSTGCSPPPSGQAWTAGRIDRLDAAARSQGGLGWAAWHGDRRLTAWNPQEREPSLSITKCIAALAAARASAEGWLEADEKAADTLAEWRTDPRKSRVTLLMLLQQTSGLEAGAAELYRHHPSDKGRAAVSLDAVDMPGTVFRYGPSHWEILGEILQRKLAARRSSLPDFLRRSVLRPIGLSSPQWRTDRRDAPYLSTGAEFSVGELGRLGRVLNRLLRGENAAGFDAARFAILTRPSKTNPAFGGGIWRNTGVSGFRSSPIEIERSISRPLPASWWHHACLSTRQPPDFAALIGSGGRRVYLWPGGDKVIVRLGSSPAWSDIRFLESA